MTVCTPPSPTQSRLLASAKCAGQALRFIAELPGIGFDMPKVVAWGAVGGVIACMPALAGHVKIQRFAADALAARVMFDVRNKKSFLKYSYTNYLQAN